MPGPVAEASAAAAADSAADEELFGVDRALDVVRAKRDRPAAEIVEAICEAARQFTAPELPADDLTVVVVKVL